MWGTDLSGSMQGAGGVGGLLAENLAGNGVQFVAYDGNGNVAALVNAATGAVSAQYEYGPFGEVIRETGSLAKLNPLRFSTKYQDDETGFLYYGYRYYNPSTGRWPNRDPLGEPGFENLRNSKFVSLPHGHKSGSSDANLYRLLNNQPISVLDVLGLDLLSDDAGSCPNGQKKVKLKHISYREGSIAFGVTSILPGKGGESIWSEIKEVLDDISDVNDLFGKEYSHKDVYGCVCALLVSSKGGPIIRITDIDAEDGSTPMNGSEIEFVIRYSIETDYSWQFPIIPCFLCQENNIVPPTPPPPGAPYNPISWPFFPK
jgi:RHS repeat-associated protein